MSPLRGALAGYLDVRRALGFRLDRAEMLIGQFLSYLEERQAPVVTTEHAVAWATAPAGAAWWHALRLSAVRPFASWLHAQDPAHEVPRPGSSRTGRTGRSRTCIPPPRSARWSRLPAAAATRSAR